MPVFTPKPRLIHAHRVAAAMTLLLSGSGFAASFVYDGQLDDHGAPAQGRYELTLQAFADPHSAVALAEPIVYDAVAVEGGRFRLEFDLPIAESDAAWLQLAVREVGSSSAASVIPGRSRATASALIGQCWSSTGDTGTDPLVNFLGTIDNQPLVLRASNASVMRLSGGLPQGAVNIVAGSSANSILPEQRGQTIAGGGHTLSSCGPDNDAPCANRTAGSYSTISGGFANLAEGNNSSIGGGESNITADSWSTVAGGRRNSATGSRSNVGGGEENLASGTNSTVAGGDGNIASDIYSTVGGGLANSAMGNTSTIAGGQGNTTQGQYTTVGGGLANTASATRATVSGGDFNTASGNSSTVGGGNRNCAGAAVSWAGGNFAKVRPGTGSGDPGAGCEGVPTNGAGGDPGTFVWADGAGVDFVSTGPNQFLVRSAGGVALNTNVIPAGTDLVVATRTAGGNSDLMMRVGASTTALNMAATSDGGLILARANITNPAAPAYTDFALFNGSGQFRLFNDSPIKPTAGGFAAASDARLKEDVRDLHGVLDRLLALRGVEFSYRSDAAQQFFVPGRHHGFIAQEVERVFPNWVSEHTSGYKLVAPQGFDALAVEALRELRIEKDVQIDALRADNAQLAARLAALERRLDIAQDRRP